MTVSLNIIPLPSPNHDSRCGAPVDMLVLHYTGMKTAQQALDRLCDAEAKVSAHYVVEEDGRIFALVDESHRAWHAGVSHWRGHDNINARSIGIEIVNPGHEWGYRDFPPVQMEAVAALCRGILARHPIPARNVVGHSDVAPARKTDPGERFAWQWLAAQGIGLWPGVQASSLFTPPPPAGEGKGGGIRRQTSAEQLQKQLAAYGYNAPLTAQWDEHTAQVITAFQRHFRPSDVGGKWDEECQQLLDALLASV